MVKKFAGGSNFIASKSQTEAASLQQRVQMDLAQEFRDSVSNFVLGSSRFDLVIRQGPRVALVEVKTGDPDLPLPSSTSAQMRLLVGEARRRFTGKEVREILPVLVTNYKISSTDQEELEEEGIKVVPIASGVSFYDARAFSDRFAKIVGLQPDISL